MKPTSFSYVLGGLKPLSIKFIETFIEKKGFKNIDKKGNAIIKQLIFSSNDFIKWQSSESR